MGTPLGDFVRAKRDSARPEDVGLPPRPRGRAPGLRRSDVADRARISVEYLTRIEQGRDRRPSPGVVAALADALALDRSEREHLRYLAKIASGTCATPEAAAEPERVVRASVLATLRMLEPGVALVTNRLGDVLATTSGFDLVVRGSGLLDDASPNLTRYVFTDPRARDLFADWDRVADELAFDLWRAPSAGSSARLVAAVESVAGPELVQRLNRHVPPVRGALQMRHATGVDLRWQRETLEIAGGDAQQLVVLVPADDATATALEALRTGSPRLLRAVP